MHNPQRRFLILAAACILATSRLARAEETVKLEAAKTEAATEVGSAACAGCHSEVAENFPKTFHGRKAKSTEKLKASCESCHGPGSLHAAAGGDKNNPGFATLKMPKSMTPSEQSGFCLSCHKDYKAVMLWKTGMHAANDVSCMKCHSVHEGEGRQSLIKGKSEVCLQCHTKQKADLRLASHHPIPEGKMDCTGCHNPHGGPNHNLIAETPNETCYKCHSEKAGPFAHEHPPVADDCLNCHKPHGSQNDRLLKQPMPFLCLACHKWPHSTRPSAASGVHPAIGTAGGENEPSINLGALELRSRCTDCHREIHGSDFRVDFKGN